MECRQCRKKGGRLDRQHWRRCLAVAYELWADNPNLCMNGLTYIDFILDLTGMERIYNIGGVMENSKRDRSRKFADFFNSKCVQ